MFDRYSNREKNSELEQCSDLVLKRQRGVADSGIKHGRTDNPLAGLGWSTEGGC